MLQGQSEAWEGTQRNEGLAGGKEARMAEKAEAGGQNLGGAWSCILGLLGFEFWTPDVEVAGFPDGAGSGGPDIRRGWGPLGYL